MTLRFILTLCSCTSSARFPSFGYLLCLHPPYLSFSLSLTTYRNTSQNQRRIRFRQNIVQHYSNPDGMTTTSHTIRSQHSPSPNPDFPISLASGCRRPGLPLHTGGKGQCTQQVHCKYITRKWIKYPPITHLVHCNHIQNFPSQYHCSVPSAGNAQYIHSVPGHVIAVFPSV